MKSGCCGILYINGGARIALLKNEAIEQEDTFSNYKKFSSTFTILPGVKEVPQEESRNSGKAK